MPDRYRVEFTRSALADLTDIGRYIAEMRGLDDAEALLDRVMERVASLDQLPFRGPIPKELDVTGERSLHQILFERYRILYEVVDDLVLVFLVADGRRDMQTLLASRLLGASPPT